MSSWIRRLLTSRRLSDGYENSRRLSDGCGHIYKKKIIFVIFGTVKKKNPRTVGSNRRILDRNVVVTFTRRSQKSINFLGI